MRILITGGAGYIGTHTCVELLNNGYEVVVIDNLCNSSEIALDRVREITGKDFPFYMADVCDEKTLDEAFSGGIDCVIHFAGLKAVGESVQKPLEYYENNLRSTFTLCKAMRKHGTKRIVFSSSATVYLGDNEMPLTEESATGCINPYGWTKYMCEQILTDVAVAYDGWSVALLRYFNPVGAHVSGRIGEDPSGTPNNLMPILSQVAIGRLPGLDVCGDDYPTPDGTGVRDYIHVVDLARGHVAAVEYCARHAGVEAINLGSGKGTSVLEMADAFERVNGVRIPREVVGRRPGDNPTSYADPAKAARLLGWRTEKTIEDMCADTWRWQSQNPQGYGED